MKVHWLEQHESAVPPGNRWLGGREQEIVSRLRFPKRRADWRLGRWTAKLAVAMLHRSPCDEESLSGIQILPAASGVPEVFAVDERLRAGISLSHSCGNALCAIADPDAELGCDVESVANRSDAFLEDFFTPAEQRLAASTRSEHTDILVTLMWSAKESTLKALHCGLRSDTRAVEIVAMGDLNAAEREWQPLTTRHASGRSFRGWWRGTGDLIQTVVTAQPDAGGSDLPVSLWEES